MSPSLKNKELYNSSFQAKIKIEDDSLVCNTVTLYY